MDPYLAQGFSNLTKALIGDAETDYQVARTGLTKAQTTEINELLPFKKDQYTADIGRLNATAGNQSAQAGKYRAETDGITALNNAVTTLSNDPTFQGRAAAVLGLPEGATLTPEALQALAVTAISGGNPSQRAAALETLGAGANSRIAESLILNGTDDKAERGALLLAPQGGQYQNPGFAETQLNAQEETKRINNRLASEDRRYATDTQYGPGGQGDRDNTAQNGWETYKADKAAEADVNVANIQQTGQNERAKNELAAKKKWENENNVIIEDGVMVFSPQAAAAYGITTKVKYGDSEVFAIDVSPDQQGGKVEIVIEHENGTGTSVFVDPQYIDKWNPVTRGDGKLVIPKGHKFKNASSPTARNTFVGNNMTEQQQKEISTELKSRIPAIMPDLPVINQTSLHDVLIQAIDAELGKNEQNEQQIFESLVRPMLSGGTIEVGGGMMSDGIIVPKYSYDQWVKARQRVNENSYPMATFTKQATDQFTRLGYTSDQIAIILEEIG
jgi:hypothetical protein